MAFDGARWLLGAPSVPNFHLLVIPYSDENILIKMVPGHVLHNGVVGLKVLQGILSELVLIRRLYVPDANTEVVRT